MDGLPEMDVPDEHDREVTDERVHHNPTSNTCSPDLTPIPDRVDLNSLQPVHEHYGASSYSDVASRDTANTSATSPSRDSPRESVTCSKPCGTVGNGPRTVSNDCTAVDISRKTAEYYDFSNDDIDDVTQSHHVTNIDRVLRTGDTSEDGHVIDNKEVTELDAVSKASTADDSIIVTKPITNADEKRCACVENTRTLTFVNHLKEHSRSSSSEDAIVPKDFNSALELFQKKRLRDKQRQCDMRSGDKASKVDLNYVYTNDVNVIDKGIEKLRTNRIKRVTKKRDKANVAIYLEKDGVDGEQASSNGQEMYMGDTRCEKPEQRSDRLTTFGDTELTTSAYNVITVVQLEEQQPPLEQPASPVACVADSAPDDGCYVDFINGTVIRADGTSGKLVYKKTEQDEYQHWCISLLGSVCGPEQLTSIMERYYAIVNSRT